MTSRGDALPKLLPCPFCGGEARRVDLDDLPETDVNAGGSLIECAQCFACTALQFDRKENLVSAWNDRAVTNRPAFPAEDYRYTAELLRSPNDKIVSATLSNNLNIILSALDHATRAMTPAPASAAEVVVREWITESYVGSHCLKPLGSGPSFGITEAMAEHNAAIRHLRAQLAEAKGENARLIKNANAEFKRSIGVEVAYSTQLAASEASLAAMREALRKHVICHWSSGVSLRELPFDECINCSGRWQPDAPEQHKADCPAALSAGAPGEDE